MSRDHFVYWLFDADGDCLYVGITKHPEKRWRQHRYEKPHMAAQVAHKRMAGPFPLPVARRLEREQQDDLQPRYDERQRAMRARLRDVSSKAPSKWTGGLPVDALTALRRDIDTWGMNA